MATGRACVGTAALTTGIIGTTLASGILNNGLGGMLDCVNGVKSLLKIKAADGTTAATV